MKELDGGSRVVELRGVPRIESGPVIDTASRLLIEAPAIIIAENDDPSKNLVMHMVPDVRDKLIERMHVTIAQDPDSERPVAGSFIIPADKEYFVRFDSTPDEDGVIPVYKGNPAEADALFRINTVMRDSLLLYRPSKSPYRFRRHSVERKED